MFFYKSHQVTLAVSSLTLAEIEEEETPHEIKAQQITNIHLKVFVTASDPV